MRALERGLEAKPFADAAEVFASEFNMVQLEQSFVGGVRSCGNQWLTCWTSSSFFRRSFLRRGYDLYCQLCSFISFLITLHSVSYIVFLAAIVVPLA